jgi:spore coat polysaccharide biosynthesis predicted glycosyltransferase SpsG
MALAEELIVRGVAVHVIGNLGGLPWAEAQVAGRGLPLHPPPTDPAGLVAAADRLGLDAMVVDSYLLPPAHSATVRASGRPVLAIVDGDVRGQAADIYVDQNLDAELATPVLPAGAIRLAGLDYALLRAAVRRLRPACVPQRREARTPRVVAFFGGTDPYGAAPILARLLIRTGAAFEAVMVGADERRREDLLALKPDRGQRIDVIAPTDELPHLLVDTDLAVSASGTSTWELLCLGVPAALIWVIDNQIIGYERTVARGLAVGLGHVSALDSSSRAAVVLRRLLTDPPVRAALAGRAWTAVDGRGAERVADVLLARL